jgi:tRNA synthetases class II core domain (F)
VVEVAGWILGRDDLLEMIGSIGGGGAGRQVAIVPTDNPYTVDGVQIDVSDGSNWIEVGECGIAHPDVLRSSGLLVPPTSGLAMGRAWTGCSCSLVSVLATDTRDPTIMNLASRSVITSSPLIPSLTASRTPAAKATHQTRRASEGNRERQSQ